MIELAGRIDGALVALRAIHFAATSVTAGILLFRFVVTSMVTIPDQAAVQLVRVQGLEVAGLAWATTLVSGLIWFALQTAAMSGLDFTEAMTVDVLSTVIRHTQFGWVCSVRLVLAVILAGCLAVDRHPAARALGLISAIGLVAAVAWTGHAAATLGQAGSLHLAADALHLIAAAAWAGGLFALIRLIATLRRRPARAGFLRGAIRSFSILGIVAVATLLLTGAVNSLLLVGSWRALAVTDYGLLLTLKIGLFVVMVGIAAVNRLWLTPRLSAPEIAGEALARLRRNSLIELSLAIAIFAIVGWLGTLHPAIHFF
jgi:putative copper resistance protein D